MPFVSKYFLKKKGKGLKQRLQGKYRKRENTTEILEGRWSLVLQIFQPEIVLSRYFSVASRSTGFLCRWRWKIVWTWEDFATMHLYFRLLQSLFFVILTNGNNIITSNWSVLHTRNCCFRKNINEIPLSGIYDSMSDIDINFCYCALAQTFMTVCLRQDDFYAKCLSNNYTQVIRSWNCWNSFVFLLTWRGTGWIDLSTRKKKCILIW